jgi:DNA-directed RNA polymerase specialized sigma24 family protein
LREEIINSIVQTGEIKDVCQNVAKNSGLAQDLYNEVILIFCEMPSEKLIKVYNSGYFKFYAVRVVLNTFNSTTSPFSRRYRHFEKKHQIGADIYEQENEYEHEKDEQINLIEVEMKKLSWYEARLFKEYLEAGSCRKLSAKTGIPFQSIWKTVSEVRKKLKEQIT